METVTFRYTGKFTTPAVSHSLGKEGRILKKLSLAMEIILHSHILIIK